MESHPRATLRPDGLRPLNAPQPVAVRLDAAGCPYQLQLAPARGPRPRAAPWLTVLEIDESWRVVDEWWRATGIDRTYYRLLVAKEREEAGRIVTIFHEASTSEWFVQRYT